MFDLASKYYFVLKNGEASLLLLLIEQYLSGADIQIKRAERTRNAISKSLRKGGDLMTADVVVVVYLADLGVVAWTLVWGPVLRRMASEVLL